MNDPIKNGKWYSVWIDQEDVDRYRLMFPLLESENEHEEHFISAILYFLLRRPKAYDYLVEKTPEIKRLKEHLSKNKSSKAPV